MRSFLLSIFISSCLCGLAPGAEAQNWQWGRSSAGTSADAWSVATDPSGNVFIAGDLNGSITGTTDFGGGVTIFIPPATTSDDVPFWVKYSSTGTPLWAGSAIVGQSYLTNIATDPSGNLIVFGLFFGDSIQIGSITLHNPTGTASTSQFFIAKISSSGTPLWGVNFGQAFSVFGFDLFYNGGVATDAAGNIYVTSSFVVPSMTIGGTTLTNSSASGHADAFIAKFSSSGSPLWAQSFGGSSDESGQGITVTQAGNVYVTGYFSSPSFAVGPSTLTDPYTTLFGERVFIGEYSSSGMPLWAQAAGGSNGSNAFGIASDISGGVYITGSFRDSTISFGGVTVGRPYPATGASTPPDPAMFLVKYSAANVAEWGKAMGSAGAPVTGMSVATAPCGRVWVTGSYTADVSIDGTVLPVVAGHDPVFIAGYDLSGSPVGRAALGSGSDDEFGIACDAEGSVYECSDVWTGTSIYAGPDTLTSPGGGERSYLCKYAGITTTASTMPGCGLTSTVLSGTPGSSGYVWSDGSTDSTLTVTTPGTYYVTSFTCGVLSIDTFHVSFSPADTFHHRYDSTVCTPGFDIPVNVHLTAPAGTNYSWFDGSATASDSVAWAGSYWVTYWTGCNFNRDTFKVTVVSPCDSTPGNTGVKKLVTAPSIVLYPNPAHSTLTIVADLPVTSVVVSNPLGEELLSDKYNAKNVVLDVSSLPAGLYLVKINGMEVRKFVKE